MPNPAATDRLNRRGLRSLPTSLRVGLLLFGFGVALIAVDVVPFVFGDTDRPLWLNLGCLLAPAGLATMLVGMWRSERAERRAAIQRLHD